MNGDDDIPVDVRIEWLEEELDGMKGQVRSLVEQMPGIIAILCLPLPRGRRLEIAFRGMENLPNAALGAIVKHYISESRMSGLSLDDALSPVVEVLGFERARKIIRASHLRETYGDHAALRWEKMGEGRSHEG